VVLLWLPQPEQSVAPFAIPTVKRSVSSTNIKLYAFMQDFAEIGCEYARNNGSDALSMMLGMFTPLRRAWPRAESNLQAARA